VAKTNPATRDLPGSPVVAHVVLRHGEGLFVAQECDLEAGVVTATGRWRHRYGPNGEEFRWGRAGTYSWPRHRIHEVRWLAGRT